MSHKTLISGTAYEVVGGAQMIDGTKFQMGGGKTLLGGTEFDIPFAKGSYTIDMSWKYQISQYDSVKDIQMPTLTYPSTEGSVSLVRKRNTCI